MRVRLWSAVLVTSGVLSCVGVGFGVAQASIPDSSGIIHACYQVHGGWLRVIGSNAQSCRHSERGISWPSTVAAGLTGWQLIDCTATLDIDGNVTVSGSPLCSGGSDQATILCPSGKVAVQEAGTLQFVQSNGTGVTVNSDGSGAVFYAGEAGAGSYSIQLVCADGST